MLLRCLLILFLSLSNSSNALVIDGHKTIKVKSANKHSSKNILPNPEQMSHNLVSSYNANYVPSINYPNSYGSINIDEEGRKNKKIKRDMGIIVTNPNSNSDVTASDSLHLAYKAFNDGKVDVALHYYTEALKTKSNNIDAMFGIAACEQIKGDTNRASKLYLQILAIDPRNSEAINNLMLILSDTNLDLAIQTLRDIEKSDSLDTVLFAQLGSLIARTGQYDKALRCLKIGLNKAPENALLTYNTAVIYELIDNKKLALKYYQYTLKNITGGDKNIISIATLDNKIKELSGQ